MKHFIIPIFVPHKGCPHDCIFCNQKRITGQYNDVEAEDVYKIIEEHLKTIDRNNSHIEISFFGGSFTGIEIEKQKEFLSIAKEYVDKGLVDEIRLSTRPDYIDREILDYLKKYGVKNIELGAQSMDDDVLMKQCRGHSSEDVVNASKLIKEYGFKLGLQMMVGLYGDSFEKDIYTAKKFIELKPDFVRIYPTLVVKDTYLEVLYKKGMYKPLELMDAVYICKELYKLFYKNNIYIMKIGLQVSDDFTLGKNVVAGPFHPAFRELVESSLLNDMILYYINTYFKESKSIDLIVNQKTLSKMYSDKKRFFNDILQQISDKKVKVHQSTDLDLFEICLRNEEKCYKMSLFDYISSII
ncbi:elongator complex protein 3 [Caloramator proteoclasticus]|uniref:Radical SAM enzyme, TIGR01210 family n=1 Tax=Caloramator proteoclasticus DSM 10124 TaxID=1121262 RepID=A0A1M4SIF1_9CLOT|nr:radical SAM protein [Caloramator proteoclasticus]SHE32044.1 radical SAM enzyme, TIGR01210 family [Caloramator proteoclasticus DSM 10124]